jgi:hypothetical protein
MPSGKPETTFEWTCAQCGAENRAVDSLVCWQCGKPLGEEKCLRHFKLTARTGFYGYGIPQNLPEGVRRLARYGLNKIGLGHLLPEKPRGRPKGSKNKSPTNRASRK